MLFSKSALFLTFILSLIFVNTNAYAQIDTDSGRASIYELPAGTRISVRMDNEINSKSSSVDDTFTGVVPEPVVVKGVAVLPAGAVIEGRVIDVRAASGGGKGGILEVVFETLRLESGEERRIEAKLVSKLKAKSTKSKSVLAILGGAAIGAIIGGVTKSGTGALIGSGVGAGAGAGSTLFIKGKDVRIKADDEFEIELNKKVVLPVDAF